MKAKLHESVRIGSRSHVGILSARLGGRLTFPPRDEFSILVVLLAVASVVVGVRATVLLAMEAVQLTLPGLGRGGAALLQDAIPVAALGLEVAATGSDLLGLLACALP